MIVFLVFRFLVFNYLFFYISFEFVFILIFCFLLGWGKTAERLQASFYMFFYTIFFSLPFLVMLVDRQASGRLVPDPPVKPLEKAQSEERGENPAHPGSVAREKLIRPLSSILSNVKTPGDRRQSQNDEIT